MHLHFEWDAKKAASNLRKHGVSFEEAAEVFRDPLTLTLFDENHGQNEERWITLGQASNRKLVVVVHTWREDGGDHIHVRLISARVATSHETQQYEG
ncbi:BrnT family toxin [Pseudomonas sp.]|uniref:BrnT family toxin n=1 Tax=Pseudomonas sp. TaxID=306 RepID=UPI0027342F05|nr:BrnT family toxin [Pseudomonas sp.]MDP3814752.1 BrnT family toxin [Pseudomonas sp.]